MQIQNNKFHRPLEAAKWPLRVAKAIIKLPTHVTAIYEQHREIAGLNEELLQSREFFSTKVDALVKEFRYLAETQAAHLQSIDKRLSNVENQRHEQVVTATSKSAQAATKERFADNHDLDNFYVGFEDKFRGNETEVKEKVSLYPKKFKALNIDYTKYPVVDLGCGRGELLEAFRDTQVRAIGLDINFEMVERAKKHGLEAVQGDAISYLQSLPPQSVGGITGMHLIEHIPFEELVILFNECFRVLQPGGMVVFETPNPENLMVGIYSFYMDPSHLHPLPPPLTGFALESAGFVNVEVLRLHNANDKPPTYEDPMLTDLAYRVYGPLDYAAIAYRPGKTEHKTDTKKKKSR